MYLEFKNVRTLHLEPTSYCNAFCPQCARTENPILKKKHVSLKQYQQWFSPEFVSQLENTYMCGNYGDPIVNPECYEIVKYFHDHGCKRVSIHTNGGVNSTEFWQKLGALGTRALFGIDGLEDTNHLYRVGVRWNKLMDNVQAFIDAGGIAEWAFLLFEHNEHQVEEALELANKMGFKKFREKASSRFVERKHDTVSRTGVTIKPSQKSQSIHQKDFNKVLEKHKTIDSYAMKTKISCRTQRENSIYVDFEGRLWPCCWMGHHYPKADFMKDHLPDLEDIYGENFNSLEHNSLEQMLSGKWFSSGLEDSWENEEKRMKVCGFTCGVEFSPATKQEVAEVCLNRN